MRRRFKYFMPERNEFSTTGEETLLSVSEYYGVKPRSEAFDADAAEGRAASLEGYRKVKAGDFVMNYMLAWKGAYGVSDHDGIVSPAYAVYKIDPAYADQRFIHHRLRSEHMRSVFRARSKGIIESRLRLYPDAFLSMKLELPDLDIQKVIADFLDSETSRIDQLIEKKQRLVALFGVKRSAFISNATVKGLNPNVDMKDTGIKWLGEVPAHWKVMPIKHLAARSLIDGPHVTPTKVHDGVPFISAESIKNGKINFEKKWGHISEADHKLYSKRYKPQRDDIFVVKLGATTGRVARVETDDDFNIWVPLAAIRPKSKAISKQVYYALQSNQVNDAYQVLWTYGTQQTLGLGTLSNLRIPVPPESEMEEIARYLERRLPKIENAIELTEQSIERLKEYRSALITAAVTGQIDVTTWGKRGQAERHLDKIEEEMRG